MKVVEHNITNGEIRCFIAPCPPGRKGDPKKRGDKKTRKVVFLRNEQTLKTEQDTIVAYHLMYCAP